MSPVPGTAAGTLMDAFLTYGIASNGRVVLYGSLKGPTVSPDNDAVYVTIESGNVSVLLREGDAAPGAGAMPGLARTLSWMPFLTVAFAAFVPLAAALYLAVSTAWTLVERGAIRRVLTRGGEPGPAATGRPAATPR